MENTFIDILHTSADRVAKAKDIATLIAASRGYSWVGLYDVNSEHISMIACSGDDPAFPAFPREQGLNGRAIKNKSVVMVNDVQNDPDYLTTFGKTQAELIIPIITPGSKEVVGTIDIESHSKDAFGESDIVFLQTCAQQIMPLWTREAPL